MPKFKYSKEPSQRQETSRFQTEDQILLNSEQKHSQVNPLRSSSYYDQQDYYYPQQYYFMPAENVVYLDANESSLRQSSLSMSPSRKIKHTMDQESIVEELSDYEGVGNQSEMDDIDQEVFLQPRDGPK